MALTTDLINTRLGWCSLSDHRMQRIQHLWMLFLEGSFCDLELISSDGQSFKTHIPVIMGALENQDITQELDDLMSVHKKKLFIRNVTASQIEHVISYAYGKNNRFGKVVSYNEIQQITSKIILQLLEEFHNTDTQNSATLNESVFCEGTIAKTVPDIKSPETKSELDTDFNRQQPEFSRESLLQRPTGLGGSLNKNDQDSKSMNLGHDASPQTPNLDLSIVKKEILLDEEISCEFPQQMYSRPIVSQGHDNEYSNSRNPVKEEVDEHNESKSVSQISPNHADKNSEEHTTCTNERNSDSGLKAANWKQISGITERTLTENCANYGCMEHKVTISTVDLSLVKKEPLSDDEFQTREADPTMHPRSIDEGNAEKNLVDEESWVDMENDTEMDNDTVAIDIYRDSVGEPFGSSCTPVTTFNVEKTVSPQKSNHHNENDLQYACTFSGRNMMDQHDKNDENCNSSKLSAQYMSDTCFKADSVSCRARSSTGLTGKEILQKMQLGVKHQRVRRPKKKKIPVRQNKYKTLLPKTTVTSGTFERDGVVPDRLDSCPLRPVKLFVNINKSSIGSQNEVDASDKHENEITEVKQEYPHTAWETSSVQSSCKSVPVNRNLDELAIPSDCSVQCNSNESLVTKKNNIESGNCNSTLSSQTEGPVVFPLASNSIFVSSNGTVYSFPIIGNNIQPYDTTKVGIGQPVTILPQSGPGSYLPLGTMPKIPQVETQTSDPSVSGSLNVLQQTGALSSIDTTTPPTTSVPISISNPSQSSLKFKIAIPRLTSSSDRHESSDFSPKIPIPKLRKVSARQILGTRRGETHQTVSPETGHQEQTETSNQKCNKSTISQLSKLVRRIPKDTGSSSKDDFHQNTHLDNSTASLSPAPVVQPINTSILSDTSNYLSLGTMQEVQRICTKGPENPEPTIEDNSAVLQQNAQSNTMEINSTNCVPSMVVNLPQPHLKFKFSIPRMNQKVPIPKLKNKREIPLLRKKKRDVGMTKTISELLSRPNYLPKTQNLLSCQEKCNEVNEEISQKTSTKEINPLDTSKLSCSEMNNANDRMKNADISTAPKIDPILIRDVHGSHSMTPAEVNVIMDKTKKIYDYEPRNEHELVASSCKVNKDETIVKTLYYDPKTDHESTSGLDHFNIPCNSDVEMKEIMLKQTKKDQESKKKGFDGNLLIDETIPDSKLNQSKRSCMYLDPSGIQNVTKTLQLNAHCREDLNFEGDEHTKQDEVYRSIFPQEGSSESEQIQSSTQNPQKTRPLDERRRTSRSSHCVKTACPNFDQNGISLINQNYRPILPRGGSFEPEIKSRERLRPKRKKRGPYRVNRIECMKKTDSMIMTSPQISESLYSVQSCSRTNQSEYSETCLGETTGHSVLESEEKQQNFTLSSDRLTGELDTAISRDNCLWKSETEVIEIKSDQDMEDENNTIDNDASDQIPAGLMQNLPAVTVDNFKQCDSKFISSPQNSAAISTLLSLKLCVNEQGNPVYEASGNSQFPIEQHEKKKPWVPVGFKNTRGKKKRRNFSAMYMYSKQNFAPIAPKPPGSQT